MRLGMGLRHVSFERDTERGGWHKIEAALAPFLYVQALSDPF